MPDLVEVEELPPEAAAGFPLDAQRLRLRFRVRFPSPDHRSLLREILDAFERKEPQADRRTLPLSRLYVYANEIELHVASDEVEAARRTVGSLIDEVNQEIVRRGAENR